MLKILQNAEEASIDNVNHTFLVEKELFTSEDEITRAYSKLLDLGLVFVNDRRYPRYYYMPDDLKNILMELFELDISEVINYSDAPEKIRYDGCSLLHDIFSFLKYVNNNEVEITPAGYICKKDLSAIYSQFVFIDKEVPSDEGYSERMEFIFRYSDIRDLVKEVDYRLVVTTKVKHWLKMKESDLFKDIYDFWKLCYSCYFYLPTSYDIMSIICELGIDSWVSYGSIEPLIKRKLQTYMKEENLWEELKSFALNPLTLMGIIATNDAEDPDEFLFSLTQLGGAIIDPDVVVAIEPRADYFSIQPNFELLAPQNLHIELIWKLEEIAKLKKTDKMMIYEISKDSIIHALRQGWTEDEILDFLTSYSKTELPQSMRQSIEDWAVHSGRAYLLDAFLLRCEDKAIVRELKASNMTRQCILGELRPKDLIVVKSCAEFLLRELGCIGYPTFPGYIRYTQQGEEKVKLYDK